jgi:enterochelin esterase-like enzyme
LLVLLAVLALALPVATLMLWSRLRGPRAVRATARLSLVGASQVAAVVFVAAALNDYGYFYASWSDLLGQSSSVGQPSSAAPGHPAAAGAAAGTATTAGPPAVSVVRQLADPGWSTPAQWASRGRVESITINGVRSRLSSHAFVYLPPQYFQAAYRRRAFPAAQVFTGFPGTDLNLLKGMDYPARLLAEVQAGRARPTVLVMLRPSVTFPRDTECTDVPSGPQALAFFAQDVPLAVAATYRVQTRGWGAVGDSTGGYCAAKLAMLHSDVFTAAVTLSGYFHTLKDNTTGELWGGSRVLKNLNNLEWRLRHLPPPPVSLLVTTAKDEAGSSGYADSRRFLVLAHAAGAPLRVESLVLDHGGHNFSTWNSELPQALSWLTQRLPAPRPVG